MTFFQPLPKKDREAAIQGEVDELTKAVPTVKIHHCPKCDNPMSPIRPLSLEGVVPSFDYACKKCNIKMRGSTGMYF